jgi:hypothetical protein
MTQENNALQLFSQSSNMFCTLPNTGTRQDKAKILNIMQNPDKALSDVIGVQLSIVHMIAHEVELVSEQTGEIEKHFRIILVDKDGVSYASVSGGITQALKSIFNIVGEPPFIDEPLEIKVLQKKGNGTNKFLTLELVKGGGGRGNPSFFYENKTWNLSKHTGQ